MPVSPELREVITAAAEMLVDAALRAIEADPHQWSTRPCQTCRTVSALVGRAFGCEKKAGRPAGGASNGS